MKQKLWAMALILALLRANWDFFYGGMEGYGALATQGCNFTQINATQSPVRVSENSFSHSITRNTHSPATGGDKASSPQITLWPHQLFRSLCSVLIVLVNGY